MPEGSEMGGGPFPILIEPPEGAVVQQTLTPVQLTRIARWVDWAAPVLAKVPANIDARHRVSLDTPISKLANVALSETLEVRAVEAAKVRDQAEFLPEVPPLDVEVDRLRAGTQGSLCVQVPSTRGVLAKHPFTVGPTRESRMRM